MQKPLCPRTRTQCTVLPVFQTKASLNRGALSSEGWVEGEVRVRRWGEEGQHVGFCLVNLADKREKKTNLK